MAGLKTAADGGPGHVFALRLQLGLAGARKNHGWFQTLPDTGRWGTDYAYRAVVAVYGICANRPAEATYAVGSLDNTGTSLSGSDSYHIHFAAGRCPARRSTSGR